MRHRNAYVLLGLPFGASRAQAQVAFARRAKTVRRATTPGPVELTDLTWALNQIDEAVKHPDSAMDIYRIPADPDAFTVTGTGLFSPPPEPAPAAPGDTDAAFAELHLAAAQAHLRRLLAVRAGQIGVPDP